MKFVTILVTGCAGDIGSGIGRILKSARVAERVVGCDIHSDHPGALIFDSCGVVARVDAPEYASTMERFVKQHGVDLIIPSTEPELRYLAEKGQFEVLAGVPVIMANSKAVTIGFDKLQTAEFLCSNGLPFPWTCPVESGPPPFLPCIIKDRLGAGSIGVNLVEEELIPYYINCRPGHIWQEFLAHEDEEYTCGLYRSGNGDIRQILFRRRLKGGVTESGVVVHNGKIERLLAKVAEALELRGSINVQLRLCDRGPVIFEINPRFSSTVVFRHLLGFQDLIWSLQEKSGQMPTEYFAPLEGTRIYRGSSEYIIGDKENSGR